MLKFYFHIVIISFVINLISPNFSYASDDEKERKHNSSRQRNYSQIEGVKTTSTKEKGKEREKFFEDPLSSQTTTTQATQQPQILNFASARLKLKTLKSDQTQENARAFYEKAYKKETTDYEGALKGYKKSAQRGFIAARLKLIKLSEEEINQEVERLAIELLQKKDKFGNNQKHGEKFETLLALYREIRQLEEAKIEVEHDKSILEGERDKGLEFSYDWEFMRTNNLDFLCFARGRQGDPTFPISPKKEEEKKNKTLVDAAYLLNYKINQLVGTVQRLKNLKATFKSQAALVYVQDIMNELKLEDWLRTLGKFRNDFNEEKDLQEKFETAEWICRYGLENELQKFGITGNIIGIIKKYSSPQYVFYPELFQELKKVRDELLSILTPYESITDPDAWSRNIWLYVQLFNTDEDSFSYMTERDEEAAKLIMLGEAERYIGSSKADISDPDIGYDYMCLRGLIRTRILKHQIWFLNESYTSYKTLLISPNINTISEFIHFARYYRTKLNGCTYKEIIDILRDSGEFYYYQSKFTQHPQDIWTCVDQNFFIRISLDPQRPNFKIGLLRRHPYNHLTGEPLFLIENHSNEILKYGSLIHGADFVMPSVNPSTNRQIWHRGDDTVLDHAHFFYRY